MPFFKIQYQVDARGVRRYPACVGGVVWSHSAYHPTESWMIGQTDAAFTPDGKDASPIGDADAAALLVQWSQLVSKRASTAEPRAMPSMAGSAAKDNVAAPKPKPQRQSVKPRAGTKAPTGSLKKK